MIECGFIYAVNKYAEKERIKQSRIDKKMDRLYEILRKKNITLSEAKTKDFNKAQIKLINDLGFKNYLEMNDKY